ncbi:hypothetical protein PC129_g5599 [Phytophthora cactorum]|uniref:Uncharacterized protein n=1 Tax=Phytophthora cactorum TaxID=29920 RepID=A0A8T1LU53_9STRA|nr:hypothetical protein Pcac1_g11740 [Phytophthora cactorum]KAG2909475.1 hypothetical protein PC114_g10132 [Phytophthora cactorum]KAG2938321.1 hypothetical protein PC117_g11288 [Phytophthora cactorum]KAG3017526.1 hypothetical protein PC119_g10991 [Phytophthora cactorum]KAG3023223.1 hypothetical protein PC120_g7670 [Phytophthora cactorum]
MPQPDYFIASASEDPATISTAYKNKQDASSSPRRVSCSPRDCCTVLTLATTTSLATAASFSTAACGESCRRSTRFLDEARVRTHQLLVLIGALTKKT